jgi:replicative DNA helicase
MTPTIEDVVLTNLVLDGENYGTRVIPFLSEDYFRQEHHRVLFRLVNEHHQKYEGFPSPEALLINLQAASGLNEATYQQAKSFLETVSLKHVATNERQLKWLVDQTESFCQEKGLYNAVNKALLILDDKQRKQERGSIPGILTAALSISFDTHIGHDYIEDAAARWESYHRSEKKIPFDLQYMNAITDGGLAPKTLTVLMASTGVGKSLAMCHMAAFNLEMGYNVLYVSAEMSEEMLSRRIDANRLDMDFQNIKRLSKEQYLSMIRAIKAPGKLKFKEFPTASAHVGHIRHLLNELRMKQGFIPDIIYIDYLNIFASSRMKKGQATSYEYVKAIAEEIRGLAVEFNVPIVTATQVNREGSKASDFNLEDVSESWGLPATADYFLALISDETMESMGQIIFKQLKNRYGSLVINRKFVVGINRGLSRLYDLEESAQSSIIHKPLQTNQSVASVVSNTIGYSSDDFSGFK